ncbi:hypothetical protein N7470_005189 [Penicillium chermesinum]|nr:hypothetical protein N7470_005189 [Penicillium chermesinum]
MDPLDPNVSRHTRSPHNEVYDPYDPIPFTTSARQRQQPTVHPVRPSSSQSADHRPSSASSSHRTLRRVRRQHEGQLPHRRAFSQDIPGPRPPQSQAAHSRRATPQVDHSLPNVPPAASEPQTDENGSTVDDPYQLLHTSYWPERTTRVSSRTASAILFALEDAIRRPIPFTVDWDEVNSPMSEMVGVAGPAGPVGNGRVQNGPRPPPVPASAGARAPSGVRTPTEIMRSRRDREARQKAEQEAREREQEELERQQAEQEQLAIAQAQSQQYAAGAAGDPATQRRARAQRVARGSETQLEPLNTAPASGGLRPSPAAQPYQGPSDASTQPIPNPSTGQHPMGSSAHLTQGQAPTASGTAGPSAAAGISKAQAPQTTQPDTSLQQPRRATFPHAFERWETLSSHWEGLTSYWIRKLEQNNDDLEKDPLSQQLARQITDLSAAGANLFHAVVELQRLRASSERKFQRWFFDTRAEQERAKELQADLERQLQTERQGRADAFAAAQAAEKDKLRTEELLREMRRELQISKDEARRAWEELGRREQEERDRTNSLRNGEPTLVGGVQVVPMIQGLPSRNTRPPTREGPYPGGPTATSMGAEYHGKGPDPNARTYYDEGPAMSPTGSDPFIEERQNSSRSDIPTSKPPYSSAPHEPSTTAASYPTHTAEQDDLHSYVGSSEAGEDEYPGFHPDPQGQGYGYAAPPRSEASDDYEHSPVHDHHYTSEAPFTGTSTAPVHAPYPPTTADYSGSDWGPETGWESMTPRHRHPTRLSDVLEEDEPSRTSPSRASQASRSIL